MRSKSAATLQGFQITGFTVRRAILPTTKEDANDSQPWKVAKISKMEGPELQSEEIPQEFGTNLVNQVFDLWLNPEIERRAQQMRSIGPFELMAAQVIFNTDKAPAIRLCSGAHFLDTKRGVS